jgi:hypothetical protein
MGRSLSGLAALALALLGFAVVGRAADATIVNSLSEMQICMEQSSKAGPVECRVTEYVTRATSGSGTISAAIFPITLPTNRKLDITLSFNPTACLVWDHTGGVEPANTTTPVRILEFSAPGGLVAGSRVRVESPCILEQRGGQQGGGALTAVRGIGTAGAGVPNLTAEIIDPRVRLSSGGAGSVETSGFTSVSAAASQSVPSVKFAAAGILGRVVSPVTTLFGDFVQYSDPPTAGTAETYPGSGANGDETPSGYGYAYNKFGVDGDVINICEHAFDMSWENVYRATSGSNGNTWVEENLDITPSDLRSTVTGGGGFSPAVGSYITFSGGGTGIVLAWNSGTGVLDWRQHFGCPLAGETVSGTGGSKTLGALQQIGFNRPFRPYLFTWDSALNKSTWEWRTISPDQPSGDRSTLKLQNGRVGINTSAQVGANFEIFGGDPNGFSSFRVQMVGSLMSTSLAGSGNAPASAAWLQMDYATLHNHFATIDYAKTLSIETPTTPPAANVVYEHAGIVIKDQRGIGSNNNAAMIVSAQTNAGGAATNGNKGNVEIAGGDWNNGHLCFGGQGATCDSLYRDQAANRFRVTTNAAPQNSAEGRLLAEVVASGNRAMATSAISAGTCNTADASISAPGAVSTDIVTFTPNADPGVNSGLLVYKAWAAADVISFRVCNPSASSITPGSVTMNWQVVR